MALIDHLSSSSKLQLNELSVLLQQVQCQVGTLSDHHWTPARNRTLSFTSSFISESSFISLTDFNSNFQNIIAKASFVKTLRCWDQSSSARSWFWSSAECGRVSQEHFLQFAATANMNRLSPTRGPAVYLLFSSGGGSPVRIGMSGKNIRRILMQAIY